MEFDDNVDESSSNNTHVNIDATRSLVLELLRAVGEDPDREGLKNTPDRVARMYTELLSGYTTDPEQVVNGALF